MKNKCLKSLKKRLYKYVIRNKIPFQIIDKGKEKWVGTCTISNGKREIKVINSDDNQNRVFAMIHELGHYYDQEFGVIQDTKRIENTADNYIAVFCGKHCSLLELAFLWETIEHYANKKIEVSFLKKKLVLLIRGIYGLTEKSRKSI